MFFDTSLTALPEFETVRNSVISDTLPVAVSGLSHFHKVHMAAVLSKSLKKTCIFLTSDEPEAMRVCADMTALGADAVYLPVRDLNLKRADAVSHEYECERLFALCRAARGVDVIVCSAAAAAQFVPKKDTLLLSSFSVRLGDTVNMDSLCEKLVNAGYTRADLVEGAGQFARRGGILDVFPSDAEHPTRIEFFGDEVDAINLFDAATQRRGEKIKELFITPAREISASKEFLTPKIEEYLSNNDNLPEIIRRNLTNDADMLKNIGTIAWTDCYMPFLKDGLESVFDYADKIVFVSEWAKVKASLEGFYESFELELSALAEEGSVIGEMQDYLVLQRDIINRMKGAVYLDSLLRSRFDAEPKELIGMSLRPVSAWTGTAAALADDIKVPLMQGYSVVVAVGSMKQASSLSRDLEGNGLKVILSERPEKTVKGSVIVTPLTLSQAGEYPASKFMLIPFGTAVGTRRKKGIKKGKAIGGIEELKAGDTVVHSVHGIGIFDGIKKIETGGIIRDYIKIKYAGSDVLYLPVTQLDLVSKYIGPGSEDSKVKLSKMGSPEWQKTKTRVKGQVKDMAKELIALYSKRQSIKGYAFSEDCDLQRDFETRFEYEETDDQLRCTLEIKKDMEKPHPMDRLLCGDVGFGKTEVALRAAFKCICDNKQVAILVPTTILALQHYTTVCRRMDVMGVRAEYISRFKSPKQVEKILSDLKAGKIDIIIGTHKLLSKDVAFKDLGLLIVDEEQRFGVGHKEKLKERYPNVDVLTLSATPIPRTLNMALSGLRDMSVIEEAPGDRFPVQTFVMEENKPVILEAIKRELRRGGQVYYLHNRTDDIARKAYILKEALPDAAISYADGKMGEDKLNSEWQKLVDHETDVLVCTTIIETGVDVPNVNTLIIEDADRFGLSQLHQLRGRVGRSPRRAYAYFTFKRGKQINDTAAKRLEAVRDFTEFGSGFRIAMRDLEIRGAGNLLGAQQHGQMESVGYDMYVRLLSEAIAEEKGEESVKSTECVVDLRINSHIPERYIDSLEARLDIYRKIADIKTKEDKSLVEEELIDRFGKIPKSVLGLMEVSLLRNRAAEFGIYEIVQRDQDIFFYVPSLALEQVNNLYRTLGKKRYMLGGKEKPYLKVKMKKEQSVLDTMNEVLSIL